MQFLEYGINHDKTILFLHGGGLAPWNYKEEAMLLKEKYHILLPILDGHNGSDCGFTTIEDAAQHIIGYIDEHLGGKVFLIGGLSLGGQILVEVLSQRKDICQYAMIESSLILPMRATAQLIKLTFLFCYPLIKKRWFAKMQFAALHIQPTFFDEYYRDSSAISKADMISFLMANANYQMKHSLANCCTKALILVGSKEQDIMKKSAEIIHQTIRNSSLEVFPGFYHGDISINHPDLYVEKMYRLIEQL